MANLENADDNTDGVEKSVSENANIDPQKVPWWTSCRLALALVAFVGFVILYALRINMSVAMVCMVNNTAVLEMTQTDEPQGMTLYNITKADGQSCSGGDGGSNLKPVMKDGEFVWSKELQGVILGSFFWGYLTTQVLGGVLASKFGGKKILGFFMLGAIIASLLVPVGAGVNPYLLMLLRIITGIGEGAFFPAISTLWASWAPPTERAKLIGFSYSGMQVGNVLALPVSGILCDKGFAGGWPSIFYVFGGAGILWFIAWMLMVYDTPSQHPRITLSERSYIESAIGPPPKSRPQNIPWRALLTSVPVWNLIITCPCITWGIYTMLTNTPTYLREVLRFDIKSNGLFSAIPYLAMAIVCSLSGWLADKALSCGLSVTWVRKICYTLGTLVPGLFLIGTSYITCEQPYVGVILLTLSMGFSGFHVTGLHPNCVDIAPPFAGIIFGMANMVATLSGIAAPYAIGRITVNQTPEQWRIVFYLAAGIYTFGAIVFCIFASGEVQDWAKPYMCQMEGDDDLEKSIDIKKGKSGRASPVQDELRMIQLDPEEQLVTTLSSEVNNTKIQDNRQGHDAKLGQDNVAFHEDGEGNINGATSVSHQKLSSNNNKESKTQETEIPEYTVHTTNSGTQDVINMEFQDEDRL